MTEYVDSLPTFPKSGIIYVLPDNSRYRWDKLKGEWVRLGESK
jgi:hypothetical protein